MGGGGMSSMMGSGGNSSDFAIYIGDLSPDVTDIVLQVGKARFKCLFIYLITAKECILATLPIC